MVAFYLCGTLLSLLGIGFANNFRDLTLIWYESGVDAWMKRRFLPLDLRQVFPYSWYRYGIGGFFILGGIFILVLTALA